MSFSNGTHPKNKKNLYILNEITDCVKICGAFELALCKLSEIVDPVNLGIFKEIINLFAKVDSVLEDHLNSNAF